jgi:hypothetical protein
VFPVTLGFSLILILLGLGFFLGTGSEAPTALIPTCFGLVFLILAFLARRDRLRMHVMHAAAALALLGLIGGAVMGVPKTVTLLGGGQVERPAAAIEQDLMALLCLVFVVLCIKSFIDARRRRRQASP